MKRNIMTFPWIFLVAVFAFGQNGCDQTKADFPDLTGESGECGPWYPGGSADAGTAENAVEIDRTFPCFVWESVSTNGEDTWLNIGEVYLEVKHSVSNAKAIVIPVIGTD